MKRTDFVQLVRDEIKSLKKNATKKEIAKLNFKSFSHTNSKVCIYGQMTGHCDSDRAMELIPKTFDRIAKNPDDIMYSNALLSFSKQSVEEGINWTALEKYLYMVDSDTHRHIIDYLKGNVKQLRIK